MKSVVLPLITSIGFLVVAVQGEESKIELSKEFAKKFDGKIPVEIVAIEKGSEIHVRISNLSTDYITVTKKPQSWASKYKHGEKWDQEAGSMITGATQSLDHVVLIPKQKRASPLSTRTVFRINQSHGSATAAKFDLKLGGYFPSLRNYEEFLVSITVPLKPNRGESGRNRD